MIYVKSLIEDKNEFLNFFLKTVWKVDLIRHFRGLNKKHLRIPVLNLVKKDITNERYLEFVVDITDANPNNPLITFTDTAADINKKTGSVKRLIALFYILYHKQKESATQFYEFTEQLSKIHIDHIQPENNDLSKKSLSISERLDFLPNLQLLHSTINSKCQEIEIDKKIEIMNNDGNGVHFLKNLADEIISDWRSSEKDIYENATRVTKFWQIRENTLNKRLTSVKDTILNLNLEGYTSALSNFQISKQEAFAQFDEYFQLTKDVNHPNFLKCNDSEYFVLKVFQLVKKDYWRIGFTAKEFTLLGTVYKNIRIFGYHPKWNKFFEYKNPTTFLKKEFNRIHYLWLTIKKLPEWKEHNLSNHHNFDT